MGLRVPWQDQYLICQSSTISEAKDFSAGSMGIELSKYALPLTNHPHIGLGQNIIKTAKSLGIAQNQRGGGYEFQAGTRLPTVTLETHYTACYLSLFLWLLFQNGSSEGPPTGYDKVYQPWTNPTPEIYCNIAHVMSSGSADSFRIRGGIVRSVTISGEEGGECKISVEIIGAYIDTNFNASSAVIDFPVGSEQWHRPASFQIANLYIPHSDLDTLLMDKFSFTVSNNATVKYNNSQSPTSFILGKLEATLNFSLMWGDPNRGGMYLIDKIKDCSEVSARISLGTYGSNAYFHGIVNSDDITADEQHKLNMTMDCAKSGSDPAVEFSIIDEQQRGIT